MKCIDKQQKTLYNKDNEARERDKKQKKEGGKMKTSGIIILITTMYYTFKQVKEFYRIAKKEIEEQKKED